ALFVAAAVSVFMFIFVRLESEELHVTILTNVCLVFDVTAAFYFLGAMYDYKNKILEPIAKMTGGAYNIGTFVSTLPFKASDIMCYRLERCKKQVFTMWLFTSLFIVPINIYGYDKYGGVAIGMIVLTALLLEIIFISVSLLCRKWVLGIIIVSLSAIAAMVFTAVSFEFFWTVDTEQAAALNKALGGSSLLSVILGIIILAGLLFAAVKIAERFASRAKNTSWKLN
ncbi:MAG: hypothetical protein K2J76_07855, partial [Oscillospiraceae bacterium]|nr:hypothetical protein [Oscillospiraceae bacterium]